MTQAHGLKKKVGLASITGLFLAFLASACGAGTKQAISHNMSAKQIEQEVLNRMKTWRDIRVDVQDTVALKGKDPHTYQISMVSRKSPAAMTMKVSTGSSSYEVVSNAQNTILYPNGSQYYSVSTSFPASPNQYRTLGVTLPQTILDSRLKSVSVLSDNVVRLTMNSVLTNNIRATTELWFDLNTNTPMKWTAQWPGGKIVEVARHYQVNPNLSPNAFHFVPPHGVKPEVVLSQTGMALDQAKKNVRFPIVLPPSQSNLALKQVNEGKSQGRTVVVLTYNNANNSPVVITESAPRTLTPPSGVSMVSENVGTLTLQVGSLPLGGEMAILTINQTLMVVEGPTATVDSLVTAWGNQSPASP